MWSVPTRIGRYDIKARIGVGGMGTLYLARDTNPTTDRLVAIKLLRASLDSPDLRQRFIREAQSLAELNHPNIVTIHDSGEFHEAPFIVMEFVRGETLAEAIKRRAPMSLGEKLRLLAELSDGLGHAHDAGIIHRDIKPANLMLDLHGRLKILDFGIARVMDAGMNRGDGLTRINVQIGTPGYMSPEQIEGGNVDARSDLFAVGAVAYELIAYKEAFSGPTAYIERKTLSGEAEPMVAAIPGLDPEVAAIIANALERDVQRRCQNAMTLRRAFDRARARIGEEPQPPRVTPPPRGSGERKSRHQRAADLAYQRALASYMEGAEGFARRSAMEALAEDPDHADARRLIVDLGALKDVEPWLPAPAAPAPPAPAAGDATTVPLMPSADQERTVLLRAVPPAIPEPAVPLPPPQRATSADAGATTAPSPAPGFPPVPDDRSPAPPVVPADDRTVLYQPAMNQPGAQPAADIDRTVLWQQALPKPESGAPAAQVGPAVAPAYSGPAAVGRTQTVPAAPVPPAGTPAGIPPRPGAAAQQKVQAKAQPKGKAPQSRRSTLQLALIAAGVVVLAAAVVAVGLFWWRPGAAPMLTIVKPAGGTLFTDDGIRCGTTGSVCTATSAKGSTVQLRAVPDAGFVFSGFTGDCASTGPAVVMSGPRSCSASFTPAQPGEPGRGGGTPTAVDLTIDRPTNGTIQGPGIVCGTLGGDCAIKQPAGTQITLAAQPDAGFALEAFTGNCDANGVVTAAAGARCGATFVAAPATPVVPAQFALKIEKPTGGTIIGPGIRCGATGSLCESPQRQGVSITLGQVADKSYKFVAFTGDCNASTGRTRTIAVRTCGATFVKETAAPTTALLTIVRPTGGTIAGGGINCGTGGSDCSVQHAIGTSIALKAHADSGFRFVAFTGDCDAVNGTAVLSGPKTCSASFAAAAVTPPPQTPAGSWSTNLPDTTVVVVRDKNSITLTFGGASEFAGYTVTMKGSSAPMSGDARKPGCDAPSRVTLRMVTDTQIVGGFELRGCNGRGVNRLGMVLMLK